MNPPNRPAPRLSSAVFLLPALLGAPTAWAEDTAPATETVAVAEGTLRVGADQLGATVWLNDAPAGTAPLVRKVSPGTYQVRVAADNFNPFVAEVKVEAGATEAVQARLFPGAGTVEFKVNAANGTVRIDGNTESALPVRISTIQPGDYGYTLAAPGYEPVSGRFSFQRGKNLYIVAELERSAGLLVVDTVPTATLVRLDGQALGPGPYRADNVPPGPHLLEVEFEDRPRIVRAADTSDGSKLSVTGQVPFEGGTTVIRTGQADAVITMSGVRVAEGKSWTFADVARGRYPVEITAPGYRPVTGRIAVDEGARAVYKVDWVAEGERARSELVEMPPWYARWTTWTIAGGTVAVGVTSAVLIAHALRPAPIPTGDVTVSLP